MDYQVVAQVITDYGYSQLESADFLDLDYSIIS
jgi:hypothetical protein